MNTYLGKTREQWIRNFGSRLNQLEYGTPEYLKAQKIYAWLCGENRKDQKLQQEAERQEVPRGEKPVNLFRYAKDNLRYK